MFIGLTVFEKKSNPIFGKIQSYKSGSNKQV